MRKNPFRLVIRRLSVLAPIVVLALAASVRGEAPPSGSSGNSWPQWRGPFLNGSSTATGLPDKLDKDKNLAWSVPLPGPGSGTPIVWENRIFVSALDAQSKKLLALCLDRSNGATLWRKEVGVGFTSN